MNRSSIGPHRAIVVIVLLLLIAVPRRSSPQLIPPLPIPPPSVRTFAVGDGPEALVFDGTNIWVANPFGNTVSKIGVGGLTNVWVANFGTNNLALIGR